MISIGIFDRSFRLLFRTIELLWNLLEHGDEEQISDQLNSRVTMRFVVRSLMKFFR